MNSLRLLVFLPPPCPPDLLCSADSGDGRSGQLAPSLGKGRSALALCFRPAGALSCCNARSALYRDSVSAIAPGFIEEVDSLTQAFKVRNQRFAFLL